MEQQIQLKRITLGSLEEVMFVQERRGIGFKSFKEFNHAMLAKQLWQLYQYPNTLVSRVLKGRYF